MPAGNYIYEFLFRSFKVHSRSLEPGRVCLSSFAPVLGFFMPLGVCHFFMDAFELVPLTYTHFSLSEPM